MKPRYASDVKTQLSIQRWTEIINDRNTTDLTIDDYCELHGLSRNAYYYWLRKIRELALDNNTVQVQESNSLVEIRPMEITSPLPAAEFIPQVITLSTNGISISVTPDVSPEFLKRTLEVIRLV